MSLVFRTTDGRWGPGLGRNLTPAEVDENFFDVHSRIAYLETYPPQPLEIAEIEVIGNQFWVRLSDGLTEFGPYTLPTAAFTWQGPWLANQDWPAYSLFIANDNLYMTLVALNTGVSFVMGPNYQLLLPMPNVFDIGLFYPQSPGYGIPSGEPITSYLAARNFYIQANAPLTRASLRVAPAADLTLPIYKNDDEIGDITFPASVTAGVITFPSQVTFAAGDVLSVMAPDTVDANAKDLRLTVAARLGTP